MWKPLTSGASVGFLVAWFVLILLWPNAIGLDLRERLGRKDALEAFTSQQPEPVDSSAQQGPTARARTLVVYVFSGSDPEYADNLRFFVREAAKENDNCDYVFVLQQGEGLSDPDPLPKLPPNARYLTHENKCFDIGTVGWVLESHVDRRKYSYFVWLNSSVRGPFLPAYLAGKMHWTEPFLGKLSSSVKLVGPTINCGGAYGRPPVPHVQSYVAATDRLGLQILLDTGSVFRCWENMMDTVLNSEIGATQALVEAGYTFDCLMLRYQGLDWRDPSVAVCNGGANPLQPGFNDGITVDPLEIMFIKVKASMRAASWPHVATAVKFDQWLSATHQRNPALRIAVAVANEWPQRQAPAVLADAKRRGQACFDHDFYIRSNMYDLGFMFTHPDPAAEAWGQFLRMGLFEGRPHRRDIAKRRASAEKQKAEALQQVVRQARAELKQIQQARQQREAEQAAAAAETARQEQAQRAFRQQQRSGWVPAVGQTVYVPLLQSYAEVAGVGAGGSLTLRKGALKIKAKVDEVRRKR
ncbi:hypothetical protein N2152v2_000131 [Parachlorella kessleri]